jgi:hypothetical protein
MNPLSLLCPGRPDNRIRTFPADIGLQSPPGGHTQDIFPGNFIIHKDFQIGVPLLNGPVNKNNGLWA